MSNQPLQKLSKRPYVPVDSDELVMLTIEWTGADEKFLRWGAPNIVNITEFKQKPHVWKLIEAVQTPGQMWMLYLDLTDDFNEEENDVDKNIDYDKIIEEVTSVNFKKEGDSCLTGSIVGGIVLKTEM